MKRLNERNTEYVTTEEIEIIRQSEWAFLIRVGEGDEQREAWVGKSIIDDPDDYEVGYSGHLVMEKWLADKLALEHDGD